MKYLQAKNPRNHLFTLPDELLLMAANYLTESEVNTLSQTCHHMHHKLNPLLYRMNQTDGRALIWAAKNGHLNTVQHFLQYMRPDYKIDNTGYKALVKACRYGHLNIVCALLAVPVPCWDLDKYSRDDTFGWRHQPFLVALENGHTDIARLILAGNCPLPSHLTFDMTAVLLGTSSIGTDTTVTEKLIERGLKLDVQNGCNAGLLHSVASQGKKALVRLLIRRGLDVDGPSGSAWTPLFDATFGGHVEVVKILLQAGANPNGNDSMILPRPIHEAMSRGSLTIVELLHQYGASLDVTHGPDRQTLLHDACQKWSSDIVRWLLKARASYTALDNHGRSPLDYAMSAGRLSIVRLLLDAGAADTASDSEELLSWAVRIYDGRLLRRMIRGGVGVSGRRDRQEQTPLHIALQEEQSSLMWQLLNAGSPIDVPDEDGATPLMVMATNQSADFLAGMLSRPDANPAQVDSRGRTALHYAVEWDNRAAVPLLLDWAPALLEIKDKDGYTPLLQATSLGRSTVAQQLLAHGARPDTSGCQGRSTLYYAVENGDKNLVQSLLKALRPGPEIIGHGGRSSLLHLATLKTQPSIARLLHEAGANPEICDKWERTPLLLAVENGNLKMTRFWVTRGADREVRGRLGETALCLAVRGRHRKIIQFLLDQGAKVNVMDNHSRTPLLWAVMQNDFPIMRLLCGSGADTHLGGAGQYSALGLAARHGRLKMVKWLGEDEGWRGGTVGGRSALSLAAEGGHYKVVSVLLQHLDGKSIDETDSQGHTALWWAIQYGHKATAEILMQAGADATRADVQELLTSTSPHGRLLRWV